VPIRCRASRITWRRSLLKDCRSLFCWKTHPPQLPAHEQNKVAATAARIAFQVPRLTHHRHVDPDYQTGAEALLQYLDEQGYQADWTLASADQYGLPQSRARVYIVAVRAMPPQQCKHTARSKVAAALSLFRRLCPAGPTEHLEALLKRSSACQQKSHFKFGDGPSGPQAAHDTDSASASAGPKTGPKKRVPKDAHAQGPK